jgi:LPS export ABC transporter protein LptC
VPAPAQTLRNAGRDSIVGPAAETRAAVVRGNLHRPLRYVLLALALVAVVAIVLWPELGAGPGRVQVTTAPVDQQITTDKDTALDARFTGIDRYGRPFVVTSPRAESADPEKGILNLVEPKSAMTLEDGRQVRLTADRGIYNPTSKVVDLFGNVVFIDDKGYRVETSEASIMLNEATVTSPQASLGTAPFGRVDGTGFVMTGGGDHVLVHGPARMLITSTQGTLP